MNWIWITLSGIASVCVKTFGQIPNSPFCENENRIYCPPGLIPEGSCTVDKIHSQDCVYKYQLNESLDGSSLHYGTSELGLVKLEPYPYVGTYRNHTNLNVSFSNIKWTSLIAKFTVLKNGSNEVLCRNFTIRNFKRGPPESTVLFWDCHWFKGKDSWLPMKVEIQALNGNYAEYRKFQFQLPNIRNIDKNNASSKDLELLVYRETHGEVTNIYWSTLPVKGGTTKYRVYLNELTECNDSAHIKNTHQLTDGTYETRIDIKLNYATCYNVSVQPWLGNSSWGRQSYSLRFSINISNTEIMKSIIVMATCVLLVVICSCFCWHFFRSKKYKKVQLKKCLLVYEPTSKEHLEVIWKFALFLESLKIHVQFFHKDFEGGIERPEDWWAKKLGHQRDSDLILVISSPQLKNGEDSMKASKYAPVFTRGFVEATLYKLLAYQLSTNNPRFIRILLPYCSRSDFYSFLSAEPCYHVLNDRFKLLQEILGLWCVPKTLFSSAFKTESWIQFENDVINITNGEKPQINLKSKSQHSLIEDSSISLLEENKSVDIPERTNHMLNEANYTDAESVVVIAEDGKDHIASKSSPYGAPIATTSTEDLDEKFKEVWKFF